ncbi:hypothetical protein F2Q68_00006010 [Brassica cretica]|uniref:Uncharacterized protein n=1 Tax=Brassica cretica TaxID=69181 RepID=A0A8S9JMI6_BRACR|nr:hypothetical protein F2Q68_00006010 [Brassica cretica]
MEILSRAIGGAVASRFESVYLPVATDYSSPAFPACFGLSSCQCLAGASA